MPDYNLGRAHGKIEIDYNGSGADEAARDLDRVAKSSADADSSLTKTSRTLKDTDRDFDSAGNSAHGYSVRLHEVRDASEDVDRAENELHRTLLDSRASLEDVQRATEDLDEAHRRHARATEAARAAHRALASELTVGQWVMRGLADLVPNMESRLTQLGRVQQDVSQKSNTLAKGLGAAARAVALLGPEGRAAAGGLEILAKGFDKAGSSASAGSSHIAGFFKQIAGFEAAFGKIAGVSLGVPSLGGLVGLGGASVLQGVVDVADAVRQLSGVLGLLPATVAGVGFSMGTLKIALHGVGDALKDMMADDPKKFLEDIANMGPLAAQSMLQVAQFRDQFKLAGGAIQESFFAKVAADIVPLIQTWLPALTSSMSRVAGIFGTFADHLAKTLMTPQAMQVFETFIDNISAGLQSMLPAITPLANIFAKLTVEGSSFFAEIGGHITNFLSAFDQMLSKAHASGALHDWIQTGINAFGHLVGAVSQFGQAFSQIMTVADKFGGGGLLGFLEKLGTQLNVWTQSSEGQQAMSSFFSTLRTATDAFLPMLKPLTEGLMSIGQAFVQLGVATAPAWQTFFNTFASTMAELGPHIAGIAPAISTFLDNLAAAMIRLTQTLGPQLPQIFQDLANAFVALLPQIPPLVQIFTQLIEHVGPQLPKFFGAVTDLIEQLIPLMPTIIGFIRDFVSAITVLVEIGAGVEKTLKQIIDVILTVGNGIADFIGDLPKNLSGIGDAIAGFFKELPGKALDWGKNLVHGLIQGMLDATGLSGLRNAAKGIVDRIASWFQSSPAKEGPFSGAGYTLIRGQKMVQDMAAGMMAAQPAIASAAASTAAAASGGLGGGRAPLPGGLETAGGALLPDNIAGADNSILDAYLRHQFPDNRGLKGLAKDLGNLLSVFQNGFNLAYQQGLQPLMQVMGMLPGANAQTWRKIPADVLARQQAAEAQRKAFEEQKNPTWGDLGLPQAPSDRTHPTAAGVPGPGNSALEAALRAKGFSDKQIRLIQAFSQVEGNNPAGNPTLGFTDAQLGGATDLQSHVDALAKQFIDRASVAGAFPEGGTDLEQAQWIAKVVGQAGLSADWQGNAQPQDYVQRVLRAMGPAGGKGPSWPQVTGGVPTAGLPIGGWFGAPSPFAGVGTGPSAGVGAPLVQPGVPNLTGLALPDVRGAHSQLALALWAVQQLFPGATLNAGKDDHGIDRGWHPKGQAIDIGFPGNDPQRLAGIAQWLMQFTPDIEQLIFSGPGVSQNILGGKAVPAIDMSGSPYTTGEAGYHGDHVHLAITDQMAQAFAAALGSGAVLPPGAVAGGIGAAAGRGGGQLVLPSGKTVQEVLDSANLSANDRLLQAYLQGNPDLAAQIGAARTPGASDAAVLQALTGIDTTISGLKAQDAIGNENTIRALQATQSQIAQSTGFAQGPTSFSQGLQVAQALGGGAANAITGVIQAIQGGLDSLTATQDIADRLVYGVRNTEDINAIVDDMQKYITFAAQIASATGSILQSIGSVISVAGQGAASAGSGPTGGDPGAAVAAVGQAFELAGMISQLVSGALQAVNAAIDFSQQAYHVAGTYFGRLLSNLVAGPGGTPLMGDVRFLLNTNTGQLLSYSRDNPGNQNALAVPGLLNAAYGYGGGNPNPQVNQQLNVYAGPGQPTGEMLREVVWMVNTSGTTGALAPSNF
ncbi:conserved hypothetical bacteriophage-related membrane protein [Mycobacterium marinum M]|uniref:Conserved hypothetical bacteriophage-related membrane protein n=1 Tax=Mycobacterium marinum (strain ATCC BAA-535 / M) TaxID=216594 RepID=B2HNP5_MYCMM|nr:hypothetical protein [Mycobacterium marinum]ACC42298.1 conserved hypothetical bacteriophage-related membrane protein [Mycobacterium marinum M]